MSNERLSQEEIDMLLKKASGEADGAPASDQAAAPSAEGAGTRPESPGATEGAPTGGALSPAPAAAPAPSNGSGGITEDEKDILGEVGNISMSTAATTLSTLISSPVSITTPKVDWVPFSEVASTFSAPKVVTLVRFSQGLTGENILIISAQDASIIADLMMGGKGDKPKDELGEMELSALSEAMNQMIGSASTATAQMINRGIDITPPETKLFSSEEEARSIESIHNDEHVAKIAFRLTVGDLIDSIIMQIYSRETMDDIISSMMGGASSQEQAPAATAPAAVAPASAQQASSQQAPSPQPTASGVAASGPSASGTSDDHILNEPVYGEETVSIQKPVLQELSPETSSRAPRNIDLIMDVPLEVSVILGKTKKSIEDILSLSKGSVVELNRFAEEPLHVYVNDKMIAKGEVVVINENFGIRITSILDVRQRVDTFE